MKTMKQMQDEMLKKARFDGGYPKPVIMPIGVIALAKNEEQYQKLQQISYRAHMVMAVGLVLTFVIPLVLILFSLFT